MRDPLSEPIRTPSPSVDAESLTELARRLPASTVGSVQTILRSVRAHLGMDVAFVSQFVGRRRYVRNVDARDEAPIAVGDSMALTDGYCLEVVEGRLPELIPDTAAVPGAMAIPETRSVPIGAHLSVPIRLRDGHLYGTFCCFSHRADRSLNERDLHFMKAFAEVAAYQIEHDLATGALNDEKLHRIDNAIAHGAPSIVAQPKVSIFDRRVVAVECLARFNLDPARGPAAWFAEAIDVDRASTLELQALRNAVHGIAALDLPASLSICLNVSARTAIETDLSRCFEPLAPSRVILELTEHDYVPDYGRLKAALDPLRRQGTRIAIDDAGAGYASMAHILNINPDYIKLDSSLTRQIDTDRKRRALAAALIEFGRQTASQIVAEGVETAGEFETLRALHVHFAQGHYISPPVTLPELPGLIRALGHD